MRGKDLVASAPRDPHLLEQDSNGIQKQIYGLQVTNDWLLFYAYCICILFTMSLLTYECSYESSSIFDECQQWAPFL